MANKENELTFRPLSEGLGFHPFSDGLPYAPVTKTAQPKPQTRWNGTGAVAAGPATLARVNLPVATPAALRVKESHPQEAQEKRDSLIPEPHFGILYVSKRIFAYLFDSVLNTALCAGSLGLVIWKQNLNPEVFLNLGALILGIGFLAVFNWALITAQEVALGTSAGKRLFGLTLRGSVFAILLRSVFFILSAGLCGAGLLWALLNRDKRCWHDIAADLQPTESAPL